MRFTRKVTFVLLLLLLVVSPLAVGGAEDSEGDHSEGETETLHNEVCFSPSTTNFSSGFVMTIANLTGMDATSAYFKPELVSVTQSGTTTNFTGFDISWEFFELGNGTVFTADGDHAEFHVDDPSSEVTVLWSIDIDSNNSTEIEGLCVDALFEVHLPAEGHAEEAEPILGTLVLTLLITLLIPGAVAMAFVRFS